MKERTQRKLAMLKCNQRLMHRTAALRELHEETGYGSGKAGEGNAEIGEVSPVLVKDPG
jgi:8-oxo-dGTP pyrophosphatase MutT (NUDIX family)